MPENSTEQITNSRAPVHGRSQPELIRNGKTHLPGRGCEILFVDPAVTDLDTILRNRRPGVEAIVLDAGHPVARQMTTALRDRRGLEAVHVIAHGAPGQVNFAAGKWSLETLENEAADFGIIGQALEDDGDLLLWSCRTGAAARGQAFVENLSRVTGVPAAAATGLVGSQALGGDWKLNIRTGPATARPPLTGEGIMSYAAVFATIEIKVSGSINKGPTTGSITYFVLDKSNNAIVGNIVLPNASQVSSFKILVKVPGPSSFDVGTYDAAGRFVSAGFTIETPALPKGAVGPSR